MVLAGAAEEKPFQLTIVPESSSEHSSSISFAKDSKRAFFVVLTNTSDKPQSIFESWNSWGYQAIAFEMIRPSGERTKVFVKPQSFSKNFPSTYVIPARGHQVFPITFNDEWDVKPDFGESGRTKIKLTAVYEVHATKESGEKKVWTGRIVSETIDTEVNHW
ncbi:hypothetical protein BH11VER1_BH11VER1_09200 [soil metagenome]